MKGSQLVHLFFYLRQWLIDHSYLQTSWVQKLWFTKFSCWSIHHNRHQIIVTIHIMPTPESRVLYHRFDNSISKKYWSLWYSSNQFKTDRMFSLAKLTNFVLMHTVAKDTIEQWSYAFADVCNYSFALIKHHNSFLTTIIWLYMHIQYKCGSLEWCTCIIQRYSRYQLCIRCIV